MLRIQFSLQIPFLGLIPSYGFPAANRFQPARYPALGAQRLTPDSPHPL